MAHIMVDGTLMGTPNREPQEYSKNIIEYKDPGRFMPTIFLLYSWGSLFVVAIAVPLMVFGWKLVGNQRTTCSTPS